MKSKLSIILPAFIAGSMMLFAQDPSIRSETDSLATNKEFTRDSVFYGCVPCCQRCTEYRTDKPGECPYCGMILQRRTVQPGTPEVEPAVLIKKIECDKPGDSSSHNTNATDGK